MASWITLRIFVGAVAVVMLVACANVTGLLMVRGTACRREFATRLALGASRSRLLRLLLVENLVLAAAGGLLAVAGAAAGLAVIKRLMTIEAQGVFRSVFGDSILPRASELGLDFGLVAMACARGVDTGRRDTRLRTVLVVAQVAMATTLLVGAGLLVTAPEASQTHSAPSRVGPLPAET